MLAIFILAVAGIVILSTTNANVAFATDVNTEISEVVEAEFSFIRLNENECSIKITNKNEATFAIIPEEAEIDGKKYKVTEIALNGFISCTKLERVTLSKNIIKIGNSAFANCPELKKVFLSNVQTIGNNAFMRCAKLSDIVIPKTVSSLGAYVFRYNNTKIKVRANQAGANWQSTWNNNNENQNVEFNSKFFEPMVFEPIYVQNTRSANEITGYKVASGQAYTEAYYEGEIITVPATYNSLSVNDMDDNCYMNIVCDKIIFNYSNNPINIPSSAFDNVTANEIIINRNITMNDATEADNRSSNIFQFATVSTIVLPNTIPFIATGMFAYCEGLKNIYFVTPSPNYSINTSEQMVNLNDAPQVTSIGENAFANTIDLKGIKIPERVNSVGADAFEGWTNTQTIYIDRLYKTEISAGWKQDWKGLCDATIIYSKYNIVFDKNGGTGGSDNVVATYNSQMPAAKAPERTGYIFGGYYLSLEDETSQYYDSNMKSIKNWMNTEEIVLHAKWTAKNYNISFIKQGGSGGSISTNATFDQPMLPETAPTRAGYQFNGYYSKPNGEGTQYYDCYMTSVQNWDIDSMDNNPIPLYADWSKLIEITSATSQINVTDRKAILVFRAAFNNNCTINISSNTVAVGMDANGKEYNMNIVIASRTTELCLIVKNIGIYAHSGQPAIKTQSSSTLYLYTIGMVNIFGCTKSNGSGTSAIECGSLFICSADNLLIYGGEGKDGTSDEIRGGNGGNGGVGVLIDNKAYILCNNVMIAGGTPGKGGDGLRGGYGGLGALPIAGTRSNVEVHRLTGLTNVHLYKSVDGANGSNIQGTNPDTNPGIYKPGTIMRPPIEIPIPTPPISGGIIK